MLLGAEHPDQLPRGPLPEPLDPGLKPCPCLQGSLATGVLVWVSPALLRSVVYKNTQARCEPSDGLGSASSCDTIATVAGRDGGV